MKKINQKIKIKVAGVLLSMVILSGCASEATTATGQTATGETVAAIASEAIASEATAEKVLPERKAEVSGVVKSIIGNEVTIALLLKENAEQGQSLSEEGVELTEEEKAEKQAAKRAENAAKSESGATTTKEIVLSGETLDLIIPVGTTILQSTGTGVFQSVEIADIYAGMSIKVWIQAAQEGGTDLVEFVQILTQ